MGTWWDSLQKDLKELSVELEKPLGTDEYTCLHWACHYGKAEVILMEPAS